MPDENTIVSIGKILARAKVGFCEKKRKKKVKNRKGKFYDTSLWGKLVKSNENRKVEEKQCLPVFLFPFFQGK